MAEKPQIYDLMLAMYLVEVMEQILIIQNW